MSLATFRSSKPLIFYALLLLSITGGALGGLVYALISDLPALAELGHFRPAQVTRIYSSDGVLLKELYRQKRIYIPYSQIPENIKNALVAVEDREFFTHGGIRFASILRALIADIRMGRVVQGGSTITQQLAKQIFLTSEKSLVRKIKEAVLAIEIENRFSKEKILELYCNQIYLGAGAYGFEAASQVYFGKSVDDLTLAESALLAGLPKAPSRYSPFKNLKLAVTRRSTVLSSMFEAGYIDKSVELASRNEKVVLVKRQKREGIAPHAVENIRQYLEKKYGTEALYFRGMKVNSTINSNLQEIANDKFIDGIIKTDKAIAHKRLYLDNTKVDGAFVAMRVYDSAVLALIGGRDFNKSQFNRATQAKRQPGSAFKPFVYMSAISAGYTPADIIVDSPVSLPDGKGGKWQPQNYSNRFYGPVRLRFALEHSLNVSSVKLLRKIGVASAIEMARRAGIVSPLANNLTLALGSSALSLMEMVNGYTTIANMGIRNKPYMIEKVSDLDGNLLEEKVPSPLRVIEPAVAYVTTRMLMGVVTNGTGKIARKIGRPVGAKTGTTNNYKDAWFLGFTPKISAGVYIGFDDGRSMGKGATGGKTAGPVFTDFMKEGLAKEPIISFHPPENVTVREIDGQSGLLYEEGCPEKIVEFFVEGSEPVKYCEPPSVESDPEY